MTHPQCEGVGRGRCCLHGSSDSGKVGYKPAKHTSLDDWVSIPEKTYPDSEIDAKGHPELAAIFTEQGLDGPVETLDATDFEKAAKESRHPVLYRGVESLLSSGGTSGAELNRTSGAELNREFLEQDSPWVGSGFNGNGWYASNLLRTAEGYSDEKPGSVLTFALRPEARVINIGDLFKKSYPVAPELRGRVQDEGAAAAMLGYDAIICGVGGDEAYYTILNRSAIVAKDPDA